jgi:GAF domain-containing protein
MIEAAQSGRNVRLDERTLAIPIVLRGHTLGVVRLKKDAAAPPWNTDEINLMDALIDQLEFALENARSHRDAQQRAARESLVTEITTKIRSTNNPQEMLEIAISELREALQAKRAQIMLQEN